MSAGREPTAGTASPRAGAPDPPGGLRRAPALDGLRGVAVAGVLAFHAGLLRGGYLGVDLFFVLSGFLITSLLLAERRATGAIRLGAFWARRARRLLPAVLLLLLGVSAYAALLARPEELGRIRADAIASLLYAANWRAILVRDDYWALFDAPSPLVHMWSLAIEEQLYALWPLAALAALRLGRGSARPLLALALGLAAASLAWTIALHAGGACVERVYLGTDTRAAALLLGAALAARTGPGWMEARRAPAASPRAKRAALEAAGLAGAAALAWAWITVGGQAGALYRGGLFLCGLAAAAVIAAASHPEEGPIARALRLPPLRWLGHISYGLYLWHWPVFAVMTEARAGLSGPRLLAAKLAASLILAVASYHAVERPIRRGAFPGRRMAIVAPAAFLAVTGAVLASTEGAVARPPSGLPVEVAAIPIPPRGASAGAVAGAPPRILVVGDSVGFYLGAEMERRSAELGAVVLNRAVVGCGLVRGSQRIRLPDGAISVRARCDDWEPRFRDEVARFDPDVALVALAGPTLGDLDIGGRWLHPCDPDFDASYARATAQAIEALGSRGAAVVIATTPYVDTGEDYAQNRERTDCINGLYEAAAAEIPFAELVDLGRWVCPSRACHEGRGGAPLRPDGTHFHGEGAALAARWLMAAIRELPLESLRANNPARRH